MKFRYTTYQCEPSAANPAGVIVRPKVLLNIVGPKGDLFDLALVDTGADHTTLPMSIAEELGIELIDEHATRSSGFSGEEIETIPGNVELAILGPDTEVRWRTCVYFARFPDETKEGCILGHVGGLQFFAALFDGEEAELTLTANAQLPRR